MSRALSKGYAGAGGAYTGILPESREIPEYCRTSVYVAEISRKLERCCNRRMDMWEIPVRDNHIPVRNATTHAGIRNTVYIGTKTLPVDPWVRKVEGAAVEAPPSSYAAAAKASLMPATAAAKWEVHKFGGASLATAGLSPPAPFRSA